MNKIIKLMVSLVLVTMLTALISSVAVSATELPFTDVKSDLWFYDDTRYLYRNGIMTGVTETEFKPTAVMSRAEFVTVLHRIAGEPEARVKAEFADVAEDAWYYDHLSWACETGLINGYFENGSYYFKGTNSSMRSEAAKICVKFLEYVRVENKIDNVPEFKDRDTFGWADEFIVKCAETGLINGYPNGTFNPTGKMTRYECGSILHKLDVLVQQPGLSLDRFDLDENPKADGNYTIDLHSEQYVPFSKSAIVFGAAKSGDGYVGYAMFTSDHEVCLYEFDTTDADNVKMTRLARDTIYWPREDGKFISDIRVEKVGGIYSFYFLDDAAGIEPWPEFQFELEAKGTLAGYADNNYEDGMSDGIVISDCSKKPYTGKTYVNPLTTSQTADPCVIYHDGVYYCYSTSAGLGYYVYSSTDLINWENRGLCIGTVWGFETQSGYYWAPDVTEYNGKFYMVLTVDGKVGFAVADSPLGPFVPEENYILPSPEQDGILVGDHTPWFIDGELFIDDDGKKYLYFNKGKYTDGPAGIYVMELCDDIVTPKYETMKRVIVPDEQWEFGENDHKLGTVEGSVMTKYNGKYYLTYSGSDYAQAWYGLGIAVSDSPMGDFVKIEAQPFLTYTYEALGPGHHSFFEAPNGELYIAYHVHYSTTEVHPRLLCIDRARFSTSKYGHVRVEVYAGPTSTPQPVPIT